MTTIGNLVSVLFARYERQFHDEQVAAVATQVTLEELLKKRGERRSKR